MTVLYSEREIVTTVTLLTPERLTMFVEAGVVSPVQGASGPCYTVLDRARIELLCDLAEGFDLDEDTLGLVMRLVDRVHDLRADLAALTEAIGAEPPEVQARIARHLARSQE